MLSVQQLTKAFGGLTAVDDLSLQVGDAEIVGLIGPNGSGKSTAIEIISGFHKPTAGRILFDNVTISRLNPHQILKIGIGRTFQNLDSLPGFTVWDTIRLAALSRFGEEDARRKTAEMIQEHGLLGKEDHFVERMNLVDRKAVEMARLRATDPKLILLDEMMAGMTDGEAEWIVAEVRRLREKGTSFLVVEHRMEIMTRLCDRVVVLNFGRKVAEGVPKDVMTNKVVVEAYLGKDAAHA